MIKKEIYLTIDDAPSKDFVEKMNFLEKNNIKAIFFCIGKNIEKRKGQVVEAIRKGFIIGNHSYSHPHFSYINLKKARKEIEQTEKLIEEAYKLANKKRKYKIFRFPYGDKGNNNKLLKFLPGNWNNKNKIDLQNILKNLGYKQPSLIVNYDWFKQKNLNRDIDIFWTIDYQEWNKRVTIQEIGARMNYKYPKEGGSLFDLSSPDIVLIHDHNETKEKFFFIINKLIKWGIKFRSIK